MKHDYILDTNIASYIIKNHPAVRRKLLTEPSNKICISCITQAELLFGVAKRPEATNLKIAVHEFLIRIDVLPWDSAAANWYALIRSELERKGKVCGGMDMMIASHALSIDATLVTNDQAFQNIDQLTLEDWTHSL